jgi:hypothetical protein
MNRPLSWYDRAITPLSPQPQASKFADWVFENSVRRSDWEPLDERERKKNMKLGSDLHRDIDLFLQSTWAKNLLGADANEHWSKYFVDDGNSRNFTAPYLRVYGKPVGCRPDLVLQNVQANKFIVIERKTTFVPEPRVPSSGWPNVKAQLWCYSWIEEFLDANEVLLVGQLWRRLGHEALVMFHQHSYWRRGDVEHHDECLKWFNRYGGTFETP